MERDELSVIQACVLARHLAASVSVRPVSSAQPETTQKYQPPRSLQLLVRKTRGRLATNFRIAPHISRCTARWNLNAVFDLNIERHESRNRLANNPPENDTKQALVGSSQHWSFGFQINAKEQGVRKNSKKQNNVFRVCPGSDVISQRDKTVHTSGRTATEVPTKK